MRLACLWIDPVNQLVLGASHGTLQQPALALRWNDNIAAAAMLVVYVVYAADPSHVGAGIPLPAYRGLPHLS